MHEVDLTFRHGREVGHPRQPAASRFSRLPRTNGDERFCRPAEGCVQTIAANSSVLRLVVGGRLRGHDEVWVFGVDEWNDHTRQNLWDKDC